MFKEVMKKTVLIVFVLGLMTSVTRAARGERISMVLEDLNSHTMWSGFVNHPQTEPVFPAGFAFDLFPFEPSGSTLGNFSIGAGTGVTLIWDGANWNVHLHVDITNTGGSIAMFQVSVTATGLQMLQPERSQVHTGWIGGIAGASGASTLSYKEGIDLSNGEYSFPPATTNAFSPLTGTAYDANMTQEIAGGTSLFSMSQSVLIDGIPSGTNIQFDATANLVAVPEPATIVQMAAICAIGAVWWGWRRHRRAPSKQGAEVAAS